MLALLLYLYFEEYEKTLTVNKDVRDIVHIWVEPCMG